MKNNFFAIADHTLTVVGQDGAYVKPFTTNYIMITPGQTMNLLVKAKQRTGYYYMASKAFLDFNSDPYNNSTTTAILQYSGIIPRPSSIPLPMLPNTKDSAAAANFTNQIKNYRRPFDIPKTINKRIITTISVNLIPCNFSTCASYTSFEKEKRIG